jgi:predicted helicase
MDKRESSMPLNAFAVCSDSDIGKKRKKDSEVVETFTHELSYPSTTEPKRLALEMKERFDKSKMSVVFSTYHSIEVISQSQKKCGLENFDLIICDEAHRTTGATFENEDESHFVKVHDPKYIRADKRLYMTATPRIFGDIAKKSAELDNVSLCSMDDEKLFGKQLYLITFSEAVQQGLLVDYKVIVLAIDENHIAERLQKILSEDNALKVDDAAKIVGCYKALSKLGQDNSLLEDGNPMQRAVAFCQVIEVTSDSKTHKVSSKQIAGMFQAVVKAYQEKETIGNAIICEAEHVDGHMNATEKETKIQWLKDESAHNVCRILSNVRCLSEGVDVPSLDAVLFLTPRSSQIDVVQSVGRVMRNSPGKKKGYVILPVVIPAGIRPEVSLNDSKTYKVVWQVLQALRSHDDRFDSMINKLDLNQYDTAKMEIIAVTDKIQPKATKQKDPQGSGDLLGSRTGKPNKTEDQSENPKLNFNFGEIEIAMYAKIVEKCGNRYHWEEWANDIAKIANTHITRIKSILADKKNAQEIKTFSDFADELRDDLNDSISNEEVIEMLAQHLITKPVFDALFSDYEFTKLNSVSRGMDAMITILEKHNIDKEADTLTKFYESVRMRASGIDSSDGRQKIILELYDKFFKNAFPKLSERLGIVYTPVEVVDFILHSVNDILQKEFNQRLGSEMVQILDPFTGTGTFITRLMQSGLLSKEELKRKYKTSIHANEIVLLAYYIASINIESVYHTITGEEYSPFEGILLTDTFQLFEKDDLISRMFVDNSNRRIRQKSMQIKVIVGNPPYSAGQKSANDNNQNIKYPHLDERIEETYAKYSTATNKNALYDSYIRAIRWASDRLGDSGVMGIVTNAGFVEGNAMDGLRKCLAEEFTSIYIFHLRGNARTSGERNRQEGGLLFSGKEFGGGSKAPIAITLFVKNSKRIEKGEIFFYDIGDYMSRKAKIEKIVEFKSINGIQTWQKILPDVHHDWIHQRDDSFSQYISMGDKKDKDSITIFENYSRGVATSRDAWVYNFSLKSLKKFVKKSIEFYNSEVDRYSKSDKKTAIDKFIRFDSKSFTWGRANKWDIEKEIKYHVNSDGIFYSAYRPFMKTNLYFDKNMNDMQYQLYKIYPTPDSENLVICVTGRGSTKEFSTMISNIIPDLEMISKSQCFPLYLYEKFEEDKDGLFPSTLREPQGANAVGHSAALRSKETEYKKKSAITEEGLKHFTEFYKEKISKEDLFYYIYGLLHCNTFIEKYKDNLSKELPRIARVKKFADFQAFTIAGRELAKLHLGYESVKNYPVKLAFSGDHTKLSKEDLYRVSQMKFKSKEDKSVLLYNPYITVSNIPLEAYTYIVNGKSALDWIVERYCIKTDKDSGIENDANAWGIEVENNPAYPLELFQRVITVSLETRKIIDGLPVLEF